MESYFDKYDLYIEKLLCVQFEASEILKHNLTKGEVREEFIKDQVRKQFDSIFYHKGVVADNDGFQSGQLDIIVTGNNARRRTFGDQSIIDIQDVKMIIEVKSCLVKKDIDDFEEKARKIKNHQFGKTIQFGLFCYKYDVKTATMLRRFGYMYDKELDMYIFNSKIAVKYNNIDFVLSVYKDETEDKEDFYLARDIIENRFILFKQEPVSKNFFIKFSNI